MLDPARKLHRGLGQVPELESGHIEHEHTVSDSGNLLSCLHEQVRQKRDFFSFVTLIAMSMKL